jgi:hypothetical protein
MVQSAQHIIQSELLTWEGVEVHPHRFGGVEFRIGRREIGHIHGDSWVDIPFPTKVRDEIVSRGEAQPHHLLPETGWISFYLRTAEDVPKAMALFKRSFELAQRQKSARVNPGEGNSDPTTSD